MPVLRFLRLSTRRLRCINGHRLQHPSWQSHLTLSQRLFSNNVKVFNLPQPGEGIHEIEILQWHVGVGDEVKEFDVILHGKSDKADLEIFAPYDGKVSKILHEVGDMAVVEQPLIEFETEGGASSDSKPSSSSPPPSPSTPSQSSSPPVPSAPATTPSFEIDGKVLATPAVRRVAKENNVNLSQVIGTGKDGRIMKHDVVNFMDGNQTGTPQPRSTPAAKPSATTTSPSISRPASTATRELQDYVKPLVGVARVMVQKMNESNAIPQFGYGDEIILNNLIKLRTELKPMAEKHGVKLSYLPFIIKAVSLALIDAPELNAHVNADCTELLVKSSHNIGVAVDSPQGLIVPVIKECQSKSILEIADDLNGVIDRAKNSKITNDDIKDGTFTLSNIGAIGGTYCSPLLFTPQVCIGALGAAKQWPRYDETGTLYPASVMAVSWSADHRVMDGATVARFSNAWKDMLEHPGHMVLNMI